MHFQYISMSYWTNTNKDLQITARELKGILMRKQNVSGGVWKSNKVNHNRQNTSITHKIYKCVEKHVQSIPQNNQRLRLSTKALIECTQTEPEDTRLSFCQTVTLSAASGRASSSPYSALALMSRNKCTLEACESIHTLTEASFNRPEKLFFHSVNTQQKGHGWSPHMLS